MKGFKRKIAFGVPTIIVLLSVGIMMMGSENSNEMFVPIVFVHAFAIGFIIWLVLNLRESKRRKEENAKRKLR